MWRRQGCLVSCKGGVITGTSQGAGLSQSPLYRTPGTAHHPQGSSDWLFLLFLLHSSIRLVHVQRIPL